MLLAALSAVVGAQSGGHDAGRSSLGNGGLMRRSRIAKLDNAVTFLFHTLQMCDKCFFFFVVVVVPEQLDNL